MATKVNKGWKFQMLKIVKIADEPDLQGADEFWKKPQQGISRKEWDRTTTREAPDGKR